MTNFLLFLLASIGLSHILVESNICDPLRTWFKNRAPKPDPGFAEHSEFIGASGYSGYSVSPTTFSWLCGKISYILGCYQCSGVWAGWFMACFTLTSWNYSIFTNLAIIIPAGFAASIASNLTAIFLTYLEANSMVK